MNELDFILCTICALLIWLLWQQLEQVKLEEERRKLMSSSKDDKEVKIKKRAKNDIHERIIMEEKEINFKKSISSFPPQSSSSSSPLQPLTASPLPPLSLQHSSPSPPPPPPPPPPSSPLLSSFSALPQLSPVSSAKTALPGATINSPNQINEQSTQHVDRSSENGSEWSSSEKHEMTLQKPWVFEGEAHYPPNFFIVAHQSKQ
ncbi:unnamed protein product [Litomosoides sigmodontis]|uniref:Uncharacterized protein n=1 Tax=Litomosoides sigmodontis TaxID=42156 RepID=A0A3P6V6H3_LITSI|nr:unnamed protein product [Litomosoides sigmodontis]